jgi:hypothetical protein
MDNQVNNVGHCLHCGGILEGRSDKKFCSIRHKNAHHNIQNRQKNVPYKMVDKQLHLNHKVLQKYYELSQGEIYLDEKPLILAGFDSRYFVGILNNQATGEKLHAVYNFGFVMNSSNQIKIYYKDGGFHNI